MLVAALFPYGFGILAVLIYSILQVPLWAWILSIMIALSTVLLFPPADPS